MALESIETLGPRSSDDLTKEEFEKAKQGALNGLGDDEFIYACTYQYAIYQAAHKVNARTYYERSIEHGCHKALFNLAVLVARGVGPRFPSDPEKAREYLKQAIEKGIEEAQAALDKLNEETA